MKRERKLSLTPTPAELAGAVAAAYFFWFLADDTKGIIAGVLGVAAGLVLSRLIKLAAPPERNLSQGVWTLVILGFAVAAPFLASAGFRTTQLATAGYTALAVLGLNLLTGYAGQASLGHSAFLGVGGYTAAIMVNQWDMSMGLAMAIGTLAAALVGLLIGIPAARLSGPYLAIATLGLAVIFTPLAKLDELAKWTGGRDGIDLFLRHEFGPPVDWGWLTNERWHYFVTMSALALAVLLAHNLLRSAVGRSFRAVRDNEIAAAAMGVNVTRTKLTAFAISSAYAGFAGGLFFILSNRFIAPETFSVLLAIEYLLAAVIGGVASIEGALLGGFFLIYASRPGGIIETVASQTEDGSNTWLLLAGTLLAASILFGSGWIDRQVRRYGVRLSQQYAGVAVNAARLGGAVALGIGLTWLFRKATEDLLDLVALRGAFSGALLIVMVLFLPGGVAGLVRIIRRLSWTDLYNWVKDRLALAPGPVALEAPEKAGPAGLPGP